MSEFLAARRDTLARGGPALAVLMTSLDASSVTASLPMLARAFGIPFQSAQWIVLASLLAVTSFTVSAGRVGDVIGRRRLLLAALALFTAASVGAAAAPSLGWLIPARVAQGISAGAMMALAVAVTGDVVPGGHAGRAMGQLAAMSAIGTTLGPVVAGAVSHAGRGAIFLVNVPLGMVAFALSLRYLPATAARGNRTRSFDAAGMLLLALTLAAYALAMTRGAEGWSRINAAFLVAALCGAGAFALAESGTASPLLPIAMFRDRALSASLATSATVATVMMATLIVGPFYLSRGLGLGPGYAGLVLSAGPAVAALTAALAGRVVDRAGAPRTAMGGLAVMALGASALAVLPLSAGVAGYAVPLVVMTAGYATFQTGNNTGVVAGVGNAQRGVVAGLLTLSRNLGLITGASVMGAVFLHATGVSDLATARPDAVAAGMRTTLAVAALLIASALALTRATAASTPGRRSSSVPVTPTPRHHLSERTSPLRRPADG
ncbi:MAG: MFS transporter [Vicinamibacterales bacterium]|nr:MFS transporter [Vicinamibacterales bacterium]